MIPRLQVEMEIGGTVQEVGVVTDILKLTNMLICLPFQVCGQARVCTYMGVSTEVRGQT